MAAETMNGRTVVVAMDGSDNARKAFQWYAQNFYRPGDQTVIVTVEHIRDGFTTAEWCSLIDCYDPNMANRIIEEKNLKLSKKLEDLANMLKEAKVSGTVECVHSSRPGKGILYAAEKYNADCIVTGSRGLNPIQRTILGSTSEYLIHNTDIPVVMCPE